MSGDSGNTVTPTDFLLTNQSNYGSSDIKPIVIGNTVLFVDFSEKIIRDFFYTLEEDRYKGNKLTVLARHLFALDTQKIKRWAYESGPRTIIWIVRADGSMIGLTYNREHKVFGYHRHETEGTFEEVSTVLNSSGGVDVYCLIKRTINGSTRRYIETMEIALETDDVRDAFCVDSGLTLDNPITVTNISAANPGVVTAASHGLSNGDRVDLSDVVGLLDSDGESVVNNKAFLVSNATANTFELHNLSDTDFDTSSYTAYVSGGKVRKAVTSISGLDHLEGEAVKVFANGNVISGKTVSAGKVTLSTGASRVHIGKGYTADIETLDFHYDTRQGPSKDKEKDMSSVVIGFEKSRELFIGPSSDRLLEVAMRSDEDYGEEIQLFTGDKEVTIEPVEDRKSSSLYLRSENPVPVTILSLIARMEHGEV